LFRYFTHLASFSGLLSYNNVNVVADKTNSTDYATDIKTSKYNSGKIICGQKQKKNKIHFPRAAVRYCYW